MLNNNGTDYARSSNNHMNTESSGGHYTYNQSRFGNISNGLGYNSKGYTSNATQEKIQSANQRMSGASGYAAKDSMQRFRISTDGSYLPLPKMNSQTSVNQIIMPK